MVLWQHVLLPEETTAIRQRAPPPTCALDRKPRGDSLPQLLKFGVFKAVPPLWMHNLFPKKTCTITCHRTFFFLHHQSLSDVWLWPCIQKSLVSWSFLSFLYLFAFHPQPTLRAWHSTRQNSWLEERMGQLTSENNLVSSGPPPELNPRRVGGSPKTKGRERLFQTCKFSDIPTDTS